MPKTEEVERKKSMRLRKKVTGKQNRKNEVESNGQHSLAAGVDEEK